jgi:hypothetical protein
MILPDTPDNDRHMPAAYLDLAVPVLSFGGAALAILAFGAGAVADLRFTALGCVLASFVLAYLAWIRPKKDIVALTTPIYALIFFAVPLDDAVATIILELLYAASLTALLVRLKYRFGTPRTVARVGDELTGPLAAYTGNTRDALHGTSTEVAHYAAVVFLRFARGEYAHVVQVSGAAVAELRSAGGAAVLGRAFSIAREQAACLEYSQPRPDHYLQFSPEDSVLLAKSPASGRSDDVAYDLALENALLLLFAAAWNASERDRPQLLAAQDFALRLLAP